MKKRIISQTRKACVLFPAAMLLIALTCSTCFAEYVVNGELGRGSLSSSGIDLSGWNGMTIEWTITPEGDHYHYEYTIDISGGGNVSHFILQVSDSFNQMGINEIQLLNDSLKYYNYENREWSSGITGFLGTYDSDNGNPGMPNELYGIKFDNGSSVVFGEEDPLKFSFDSLRAPVWGDFYAKDGKDTYAWNTGFGLDPYSGQYLKEYGYIATIDTTIVPLPATILLGFLGMGIGGWKLKKTI